MLDLCTDFANTTDLECNNIKSHLMQIGLSRNVIIPNLKLAGIEVLWVDEFEYLGVVFIAVKKFSVNINVNCRKI